MGHGLTETGDVMKWARGEPRATGSALHGLVSRRLSSALDLTAPRAGLGPARLDEFLEALQIALHSGIRCVKRAADFFDRSFWFVFHAHTNFGFIRAHRTELDETRVRSAIDAAP